MSWRVEKARRTSLTPAGRCRRNQRQLCVRGGSGLSSRHRCADVPAGARMAHLAISLVVAWCCGLLFLAGRNLNFTRLSYNNLAPGKTWKYKNIFSFYFLSFRVLSDASAIDPACLTEAGRQYRENAILNDRIICLGARRLRPSAVGLFLFFMTIPRTRPAHFFQLVTFDPSATSPEPCTVCATIFKAPPDSITVCANSANWLSVRS